MLQLFPQEQNRKRKDFITMRKLWKKATIISTTALLLCLTSTTTTTFATIVTETNQIPEDERDNRENKEHEPEIQPLSDRKNDKDITETPLS